MAKMKASARNDLFKSLFNDFIGNTFLGKACEAISVKGEFASYTRSPK